MPSTSITLAVLAATSPTSQRYFQLMRPPDWSVSRGEKGAGRSERPVRALVEPAVGKPHLAGQEPRGAVPDPQRVGVPADQEQPALPGVDMRVRAVEEMLEDDEGTHRPGAGAVLG